MNLTVKPEYAAMWGTLSPAQYAELKNSIKQHGLYEKLVVNPQGIILDGHNRHKACMELGRTITEADIEVKSFEDPLHEQLFILDTNLARRHITTFEKIEKAVSKLAIEKQLAERRRQASLPSPGEKGFQPVSVKDMTHTGRAAELAAQTAGVSYLTLLKAQTILEKGAEDLRRKVRSGAMSIDYAYKMVRSQEIIATPQLPEGLYDVILADPPWKYYLPLRGAPDTHYPTMEDDEIKALGPKLPVAERAVLFLWATNPKLQEALETMKNWGFQYRTNLTWIKDKIGTGYFVRGQHELLLVGTKGSMGPPREDRRPSSVIQAPRREHSQKPDEAYARIEQMYPIREYSHLELFARQRRRSWTAWGLDLSKNIQILKTLDTGVA